MDKYALYSTINAWFDDFSFEHVEQFVDIVHRLSQQACPYDTGALKNSWYVEPEILDDSHARIRFGYNKDYAMPVDYYTGGDDQNGFFSGAVKIAFAMMQTKKSGQIQENAKVRGINTEGNITKPGKTDPLKWER